MRAAWTFSISLPLVVFFVLALAGQDSNKPTLVLGSTYGEFELGEPILLRLRIENSGTSPFFIERPRTLGRGALQITATGPKCKAKVGSAHFDATAENQRYFLVPLLVGDAIEIGLPAFNDLGGLDTLVLRDAGSYTIQATWVSRGATAIGDALPIWRGTVDSEPLKISLLPPDSRRVKAYGDQIRDCLLEPICQNIEAIEYFRIVKTSSVAHDLRRILLRDYEANPRVAEAVANQGGPADIEALNKVARLTKLPEVRNYFMLLARQAGSTDPCAHED